MINFLLGVLCCGLAILPFILDYLSEIADLKDKLKGMKENYKLKEVNIKPHIANNPLLYEGVLDQLLKEQKKEITKRTIKAKRKKNVKAPKSKRN